jgi:hypothetical protein
MKNVRSANPPSAYECDDPWVVPDPCVFPEPLIVPDPLVIPDVVISQSCHPSTLAAIGPEMHAAAL